MWYEPIVESLVSIEEAGRALGVSVSTVWRRLRAGEIASVRRGGRRLIPRRALEKHARVESREIPPFDENHAIFGLAGAARSGGRKPGARDKHAILAE